MLGAYDMGLYDVKMPAGALPEARFYLTTVYAGRALPRDGHVERRGARRGLGRRRAAHARRDRGAPGRPYAVAGALRRPDAPRLVLVRTGLDADRPAHLLAMRWFDDPAVLPFDCFGGTPPQATYSFGAPPALESAEVTLRGELLAATVGGQAAAVALKRTLPNGNRVYRVEGGGRRAEDGDARLRRPRLR